MRIYNNLLLIGVLKWLASWNWSILPSGYWSASTQSARKVKSTQVTKQSKEDKKKQEPPTRMHYLAISPRNIFKSTVSAISSALCPVTSLSTFNNAAPRSRALKTAINQPHQIHKSYSSHENINIKLHAKTFR